jgi:isoamylase
MLANGTPMFSAGDEFLNTQSGNNNPYCQDNEISWLDWRQLQENRDFHRFCRLMIAFRKCHPSIARSRYWRDDIRWHGAGNEVDMSHDSRQMAYYLDGRSENDADLYVMINTGPQDQSFVIQQAALSGWKQVIDTSATSPNDFYDLAEAPELTSENVLIKGRSIAVYVRPRQATSSCSIAP